MSEDLSLRVPSKRESLNIVYDEVDAFGRRLDWTPELLYGVKLVLEEAVLNVIKYGFDDDDDEHEIDVALSTDGDMLTIRIADDGKAFDPLRDAAEPDLDAPLEKRRVGGLGVHLMRTIMDELDYKREAGRNHLTLVKRVG